ncbi:MAG: peptide chain release factor N(5)-glutamine methyltransferase [Bacteroidia bacterium]|nr:peptide chain release factor N(5)-glutamine methyltransferase [Bacteroidia bacterium]
MYLTLRGIKNRFKEELAETYSEREVDQLFYRLVRFVTGMDRAELVLNYDSDLAEEKSQELIACLERLVLGEPVQYVDNQSFFMGNTYYVDDSVLIPRPETEELVQRILHQHGKGSQRLLDIGTGSGIIPISLAIERPNWEIWACDVSNEALITARRNARELVKYSEVRFYRDNILEASTQHAEPMDIIVSNPPYVLESDKQEMSRQVLDHEPHMALFVSDNDALLFYKAIVHYAQNNLVTGGRLYFEIHEELSSQVVELLESNGYKDVNALSDMQGKQRFVEGEKV